MFVSPYCWLKKLIFAFHEEEEEIIIQPDFNWKLLELSPHVSEAVPSEDLVLGQT
jgi:hypothetical protein